MLFGQKEKLQVEHTRRMFTTTRSIRDVLEYEGEISNGDPIMLICEFTIEDPEARAASAEQAKQKLAALESGEWDGSQEEEVVESPGVLDALDELLDD